MSRSHPARVTDLPAHQLPITSALDGLPDQPDSNETMYRMTVTPEVANRWLTRHAYERQRKRQEHSVVQLAEAIRGERFDAASPIQFARVGPNGPRRLIDGQHRLAAIAYSGIPTEMYVREIVVPDDEALHLAYSRLDRGRARNAVDILRALGNQADIPTNSYRVLANAAGFVMNGFAPLTMTAQDPATVIARDTEMRARLLSEPEWHEAALALIEATSGARGGGLRRIEHQAVCSVALTTMRYAPDSATAFWGTVSSTNGLVEDEPAQTLARWLILRERGRRPLHISRTVASAWNAFQEGRPLRGFSIRPETLSRPIKLLGTPYDGERHITVMPSDVSAVH